MKRLLFFIPLAVFGAFAIAFWLGLGRDPSLLPSALIGKTMPTFALESVRVGDQPFTHDALNGRIALVNVFGSWCVQCQVEHPTLMSLAATERDIALYGVDWKEPIDEGRQYLADNGDPYAQVGSDASGRFALELGVSGAPETFIVDRAGRIRYRQVGPITPDVWRDAIRPVILQLQNE